MERVLIVDDEPKVCQLICELIDWKSFNMEIAGTAHDGFKALELAIELKPDIIITDIRMPGYDGLELINRIKESGLDSEIIIISGYSHFEYAQKAIKYGIEEYLLKPIKKDELERTLLKLHEKIKQKKEKLSREEQIHLRIQKDMKKLRSSFITEARSGEMTLEDDNTDTNLEYINENYHFNLKPGCFQVAAIKIDCDDEYEKSINILEPKCIEVLKTKLNPLCHDMEILTEDRTIYCFLNFDKKNSKPIRKKLKSAFDEILIQSVPFECVHITLCVGSATNDIKDLKDCFNSTDFAVKERLLAGTGKLIEDVPYRENTVLMNSLLAQLNKSMTSALDILDVDAVADIIDSVKLQILSGQPFTGNEIFQLAEEILNIYLMAMRNNNIDVPDTEQLVNEFNSSAEKSATIHQLFGLLNKSITESLQAIIEKKRQDDTRPIRLAKNYIQQNYMNPITLEEVSDLVGFNASYFSTLFKKETGINFVQYLSEIRMEKAKELLKESNLSVAAICEEVGYSDLKHFTKSFRKTTGIKPNEYRKLYS